MSAQSSGGGTPQRLLPTLKDDVGHVFADVKKRGIGRTFNTSLAEMEAFYLDESSRQKLERMGRFRRFIRRILWLVRGLLLKLTPARRVLLVAGLVFLIGAFDYNTDRGLSTSLQLPTAGAVLIAIVLMLELKDKLVAKNELVAGRVVQLALMPDASPSISGWDVWLYTQPANDVGGDLVDHMRLGGGQHGLCLGDVAGKALPAALLMVKLQATLRALAPDSPTLDVLATRTNHILIRDGLANRFATLFYLVLGEDSGLVRYLNAGHLLPSVIRGDTIETLAGGSMALGMIETATFIEQGTELAEGDVLVIVSDGVVEASNAADEFYGDDRLRAAIATTTGRSARAIGEVVLASLAAFVGETKPYDDVSVVVVHRRGRVESGGQGFVS